MYGPIDVIALTGMSNIICICASITYMFFKWFQLIWLILAGEKVDIHIMKDAPAGEWTHLSTEVTDKNGRITYKIPDDKALEHGLYPIKMIVR